MGKHHKEIEKEECYRCIGTDFEKDFGLEEGHEFKSHHCQAAIPAIRINAINVRR